MKTLAQLKHELGVESIDFMKSPKTGREFATVMNKLGKQVSIIVAKGLDKAQSIFASWNEEKQAYILVNANLEAGCTM